MKRLVISCIFLMVIGIVGYEGVSLGLFMLSPLRAAGPEGAVVEIHKGMGPREITRALVASGGLKADDERSFLLLGKLNRAWRRIKAGEYKITAQMTPNDAFAVLDSGISIIHPITVREGENSYEVAADLQARGLASKEQVIHLVHDLKFIHAIGMKDPEARSLEGYLFPDTYFFNKTMSAEDMLRQMYHHWSTVWSPQWDARARELRMTRFQVLTLASIIEKETGAAQERPVISSVFHNRLRQHMKLQSDPTTIYGIWDHYDGNLHKADMASETPYNTYYVPALPIGPISNPGREAITAALYPSTTEFLFFVSHNDGTHEFTKTYDDHLGAVRKFQLDPKAREGKSWRDLAKKGAAASP